jgi:hypothetical protein
MLWLPEGIMEVAVSSRGTGGAYCSTLRTKGVRVKSGYLKVRRPGYSCNADAFAFFFHFKNPTCLP